jgi:hypothetical protein
LFTDIAVSVRLGLLVSQTGTIPADILKLSYRIIKNPATKNSAVDAFPLTEMIPLACHCGLQNSEVSQRYYFVESTSVSVSPGDIFILKIERKAPDGFPDRLVLLRKSGLLNFT